MSRARGSKGRHAGEEKPYWRTVNEQEVRKGPRKKKHNPQGSRKGRKQSGKRKAKASTRKRKRKEDPQAEMLRGIADAFGTMTDPRVNRRRRHKLIDIIVIAMCAVICSCESWKDIAAWGRSHRKWLERFLELPNGIPSRDTIRRVICRLDPVEFQKCFLSWTCWLATHDKRFLHIDGKTLRRSGRVKNVDKPLHIVSVWASEHNIALGQTTVEDKSNEITAIPKLLEMLDVSGALITIDAMGCQKEIASKIIAGKGDYCLAVKGNQEHLEEDLCNHFSHCLDVGFADIKYEQVTTTDKGHGRKERREYYVTEVPDTLRNADDWTGLRAVGMAVSQREIKGQQEGDIRYYILSFNDVNRFAQAVRDHWSIENSLHWIMDVTFREDESRIQSEMGASNFSWLRRFAISLLKNEPTMKDTVRQKRMEATRNVDYLMAVLLAAAQKTQEN